MAGQVYTALKIRDPLPEAEEFPFFFASNSLLRDESQQIQNGGKQYGFIACSSTNHRKDACFWSNREWQEARADFRDHGMLICCWDADHGMLIEFITNTRENTTRYYVEPRPTLFVIIHELERDRKMSYIRRWSLTYHYYKCSKLCPIFSEQLQIDTMVSGSVYLLSPITSIGDYKWFIFHTIRNWWISYTPYCQWISEHELQFILRWAFVVETANLFLLSYFSHFGC